MHLLKVFAVYDSAAGAHVHLFVLSSRGLAKREFSAMANDPKTKIGQHPDDYTLFELGTYDDVSGVIVMHDAKLSLGCALDYKFEPECGTGPGKPN